MKHITSAQNPLVKFSIKLKDNHFRKKTGKILIEGKRELAYAIKAGIRIETVILCSELWRNTDDMGRPDFPEDIAIDLTPEIYSKLSYRENPDGYMAIALTPKSELNAIMLSALPLVIILESVEKPGNLGAVLRTADAVGADALIIADEKADIYNPNAIRASQGTVFTVQNAKASTDETIAWCARNDLSIITALPGAQLSHFQADYKKPCALVFGAEDIGLSSKWIKKADTKIKIPMRGKIDSLNVSASAAIIAYEALRQRMEKN